MDGAEQQHVGHVHGGQGGGVGAPHYLVDGQGMPSDGALGAGGSGAGGSADATSELLIGPHQPGSSSSAGGSMPPPYPSGYEQQQQQHQQPGSMDPNKYKTKLCRNFTQKGHCSFGSACMFAHGDRDLQSYSSAPLPAAGGAGHEGPGAYGLLGTYGGNHGHGGMMGGGMGVVGGGLHGHHHHMGAPRVEMSKFKTKLCRHFQNSGSCPFQERCGFAHGPAELVAGPPPPSPSLGMEGMGIPRGMPNMAIPGPMHHHHHLGMMGPGGSLMAAPASPSIGVGGPGGAGAGMGRVPPPYGSAVGIAHHGYSDPRFYGAPHMHPSGAAVIPGGEGALHAGHLPQMKRPPVMELAKTRLCRHFASTGSCPYEAQCLFAHGTADLRPRAEGQPGFSPALPPQGVPQPHLMARSMPMRYPAMGAAPAGWTGEPYAAYLPSA